MPVQVVDVDDGVVLVQTRCAARRQDRTGRDGSRAPLPQTNGTPPVISLTHTFTLCTPTPRLISLHPSSQRFCYGNFIKTLLLLMERQSPPPPGFLNRHPIVSTPRLNCTRKDNDLYVEPSYTVLLKGFSIVRYLRLVFL